MIRNFKTIWIWSYVAAVVLFPALKMHGKFIFFAELLLLPAVVLGLQKFSLKELKSPIFRATVFVFGALLVTFASGINRGELGQFITVYDWAQVSDAFNFKVEVIKFLRWTLMFSTPLLVALWFEKESGTASFLKATVILGGVSAALSSLEGLGLIELKNIYPYPHDINWEGRSYGTFPSPLEASLAYGAIFVASLMIPGRWPKLVSALALVALALTHSATGLLAATAGSLVWAITFKKHKQANGLFPASWLQSKWGNFSTRILMWKKWLLLCSDHPLLFLTGMGFTQLVVDNSFLMFFVYGGVILAVAVLYYFKTVLRFTTKISLPLLIVWFVSWVSLDSVGYWGIGRLCWVLMGLMIAQKGERSSSPHLPSEATTPC